MTKPLIVAFGSQIKGRNTSSSDYDFGVLKTAPMSLAERTDMSLYIAKKMSINEDKIDEGHLPDFIKSSNLRNILTHEYDFDEDTDLSTLG